MTKWKKLFGLSSIIVGIIFFNTQTSAFADADVQGAGETIIFYEPEKINNKQINSDTINSNNAQSKSNIIHEKSLPKTNEEEFPIIAVIGIMLVAISYLFKKSTNRFK